MKTQTLSIIIIITLAVTSLACGPTVWVGTRGSGRVMEKAFTVRNFDGVELATQCNLYIEIGEEEALRIEAEDNLLKYFMTDVRGGMLTIHTQPGVNLRPMRPINCYLTAKSLNKIVLSGSGDIEAPDLDADDFEVRISGSGKIELQDVTADTVNVRIGGSGDMTVAKVETEDVAITIAGSGSIELDKVDADMLDVHVPGSGTVGIAGGEVDKQTVAVGGSGDYRAKGVESSEAEVRISGSGTATLKVEEYLDVTISGSGDVRYVGQPMLEKSVSGSGDITQVGD